MGRPRKSKRHVPPYVYLAKNRWFWREYRGRGKFGREVRLGDADATDQEIWDAYLTKVGTRTKLGTVRHLFEAFVASKEFARRANKTQAEYRRYAKHICDTKLRDGSRFGELAAKRITVPVIRKLMNKRGEGRPIAANREQEFISAAYQWGIEEGLASVNPAAGVTAYPEKPRTRLVTDEEYKAVYKRANPYIKVAMEFAFLCRLRRVEIIGPDPKDIKEGEDVKVIGLREQHVEKVGLRVIRAKGSKEQIIKWTQRLRDAVAAARVLPGDNPDGYLVHDRNGNKIRPTAFRSAWVRAMAQAVKKDQIERFTFHDLKAKGVSDFVGDKLKASGHKSSKMADDYNRKLDTVKSTK